MKLIDANKVEKITWEEPRYNDPLNVLTEIRDKIRALPTVDAVPVIRCKDCKSYEERVSFNGLFSGYCNCVAHMTNEDCFCSWAERKEE